MNEMDKLKKFLGERGYSFYKNNIFRDNLCDWYACKRTESKRECTSTKKPVQIVVTPLKYDRIISFTSVKVDLTAEFNGIWWSLKAYSLTPADVIKNLEMIESSLVKAWEAL